MISVIIPTLNEEDYVANIIYFLRECENESIPLEIIISDGGSTDQTISIAEKAGADLVLRSGKKGRSAQMNFGAFYAKGDILYFLHADTFPPANFAMQINHAVKNKCSSGCFTLRFDHTHWFLKTNCWFTRFNVNAFRFGDQSLFVNRKLFNFVHGFSEKHFLLEDQEIITRLKKNSRFAVIQEPVTTSARKYLQNGIYKTQGIFFLIYLMYRLGVGQQNLLNTYRKLICQDKL
ncbi:MAG: TIGR04283 family arsenosugar biosynthesis glycosyltransferase [Flavobacterium sp.]|nr:TIGR04283 family arsenosugar biosynthesis glycosyltransferase [Pedobacter sp.]